MGWEGRGTTGAEDERRRRGVGEGRCRSWAEGESGEGGEGPGAVALHGECEVEELGFAEVAADDL